MQTITATLGPDHLGTVYSNVLILGPGASVNYSAVYSAGSAARVALEYTDKNGVWREHTYAQFDGAPDNYSGRFTNTGTSNKRVRFKSTNTVDATNDATIVTLVSLEGEKIVSAPSETGEEAFFSLNATSQTGTKKYTYVDAAALTVSGADFSTDINNVAATAVVALKAHLTQGSTGTATLSAFALDAQLSINASGSGDGIMAAARLAMYSDSAVSDPQGADVLDYLYIENAGNATGGADVDTDVNLFHLVGHTIGSGNLVEAVGTAYALAEFTHSIRIKIGSTLYYIPISNLAAHLT